MSTTQDKNIIEIDTDNLNLHVLPASAAINEKRVGAAGEPG